MKHMIAGIVLAGTLLTGCATLERLDTIQSQAEKLIRPGLEQAAIATEQTIPGRLTRREAQDIALDHAKLTRGQVSRMETEYDPGDGRPRYEVEFRQGRREYHYEIDARTGEILESGWEQ